MKKFLLFILSASLIIGATGGCGESNSNESEKGTTVLNETLSDNKDSASIEGTADSNLFNIRKYAENGGLWASENLSLLGGGITLQIKVDEEQNKALFEFKLTPPAPPTRYALVSAEKDLSELTSNEVEIEFDKDGTGNSGKLKFVFASDSIFYTVEINEVEEEPPLYINLWGYYSNAGNLVSNPDALDIIEYTPEKYQEEYDKMYGHNTTSPDDSDQGVTIITKPEQTYDTSKASGILASLGMTEQEFRDSCTPLQYVESKYYVSPTEVEFDDCTYILIDGGKTILDMREYPEKYLNQYFKLALAVGDKSIVNGDIPAYSTSMRYYIDYYNEGYIPIIIYDRRDNTKSPNISTGNRIVTYCVFSECYTSEDGVDYLVFNMLSLDK